MTYGWMAHVCMIHGYLELSFWYFIAWHMTGGHVVKRKLVGQNLVGQ